MEKEQAITRYLIDRYHPQALIAYGSFADGSAGENSDFDALLIYEGDQCHDNTVIDGTVLDVFCYPAGHFQGDYDPKAFLQVFDGKIIRDEGGIARRLKEKVLAYYAALPGKTDAELLQEIGWCEKMLARTVRCDAEGYYRWHWLLMDSLEIYFDIIKTHYHGPKKALRYMEAHDPGGFSVYYDALSHFTRAALEDWLAYMKKTLNEP